MRNPDLPRTPDDPPADSEFKGRMLPTETAKNVVPYVSPHKVACPTCGAKPGMGCTLKVVGGRLHRHKARLREETA